METSPGTGDIDIAAVMISSTSGAYIQSMIHKHPRRRIDGRLVINKACMRDERRWHALHNVEDVHADTSIDIDAPLVQESVEQQASSSTRSRRLGTSDIVTGSATVAAGATVVQSGRDIDAAATTTATATVAAIASAPEHTDAIVTGGRITLHDADVTLTAEFIRYVTMRFSKTDRLHSIHHRILYLVYRLYMFSVCV